MNPKEDFAVCQVCAKAISVQDILRPDFLFLIDNSDMDDCCKNSYKLVRMSLIEARLDRKNHVPRPKRKGIKLDG